MTKEDLGKIVKAAVQAPSGENAQPWKLEYVDNILYVYRASFNDVQYAQIVEQGELLALGAVIENISIASRSLGYLADISYLTSNDAVAGITFSKIKPDSELYEEIFRRTTNRKLYRKDTIDESILSDLAVGSNDSGIQVKFFTGPQNLQKIANLTSYGESLFLGNNWLRQFFLGNILFNTTTVRRRGFVLKTLELPAPAQAIFRLCRNPKLGKLFAKFGLPKMVQSEFKKMFTQGPAVGVIVIDKYDKLTLLKAGRAMQKLWLKATHYGLYIHPSCALIFLGHELSKHNITELSANERENIVDKYGKLKKLLEVTGSQEITFLFRIGYADVPSAVSPKIEEDILDYHA